MNAKTFLTGAAMGLALTTSSAALAHDFDRDGRPDRSWSERHDCDGYRDSRDCYRRDGHGRYESWRHRPYVERYVVFRTVRDHGYRYVGAPYWYGNRYVVRAYDHHGRLVFINVDPYSGAWLGVSFRL